MAKHELNDKHRHFLDVMGVPHSHLDEVEVDAAELAKAERDVRHQDPAEKHVHERALARLMAHTHARDVVTAKNPAASIGHVPVVKPVNYSRDVVKWLRIIAGLLLLLALLNLRAHAQAWSQINVIKWQQSGVTQATYAAPFTVNFTSCTVSKSGSTLTVSACGAATPGGSSGQVQWNSSNAFAGISSMTTDGTVVTQLSGADFLLADITTPTKKAQFDLSNITAANTRTINIPDASSTTVQANTGATHNFLTAISAQGVVSRAQPACSDLSNAAASCSTDTTNASNITSGTLPLAQHSALTLNKQDQTGNITGTAADANVYTYSMPSGTLASGKCLRVMAWTIHNTGTAATVFKLNFGGTSVLTVTSSATGTTGPTGVQRFEETVCNNSGSTTAQWATGHFSQTTASVFNHYFASPSENTNSGSAIAINLTFNVANTDTVKGLGWLVEAIP